MTEKKHIGRAKGVPNRVTADVRELVKKLFTDNFDGIQEDLKNMNARDRVFAMIKLLDFILPKNFKIEMTDFTLKDFLELPVSERQNVLNKINIENEGNN